MALEQRWYLGPSSTLGETRRGLGFLLLERQLAAMRRGRCSDTSGAGVRERVFLRAARHLDREVRQPKPPQALLVESALAGRARDERDDAAAIAAPERPDVQIADADVVDALERRADGVFEA